MNDVGQYIMPFGKHKGMTLDEIARTDEGLRYLDWAAGEFDGSVGDAVKKYVSIPAIAKDIGDILGLGLDD